MFEHRTPEDTRYSDPEAVLAGKCLTCSTVVQCLRRDAVKQSKGMLGTWSDLLSTECPECKARVFVMPVEALKKAVTEAGK